MVKFLLLAASHAIVLALGVALGIYLLPILAAPPAPSSAEVRAAASGAAYRTAFTRQLKGSDPLHWGEGAVTVGPQAVTLAGRIAPGPAYRLYLVPQFVETGEEFLRLKARSLAVADIRTFDNFVVPLPAGVQLEQYDTVLVWCESFSQFITAAKYR